MKSRIYLILMVAMLTGMNALADNSQPPEAVGPVPSSEQVSWQQMETYALRTEHI